MEIILGKTAGFCAGVQESVNRTKEILGKSNNKTYCLGQLVHNEDQIKELEQKGLKIIEDIEQAKQSIIFRAHGVAKEIYIKAKKLDLKINDLTCPKVLKIHKIAEEYSEKGYHIFLIGKANHPEVIGIKSFCGEYSNIIQTIEDVENALKDIKKDRLLIIEQTTYNIRRFEEILEKINLLIDKNIEIKVEKTICKATELRQKETEEISKQVDSMIIIGGKNSSNTNKLFNIAEEYCKNVKFIQNKSELNIEDFKESKRIGIMAGASTPKQIIDDVIQEIKQKIK